MDLDETTKERINQLQLMEQKITTLASQKQQFQSQLMEVTSAIEEAKPSKKVYRIIGNIMVLSDKEKIEKDLTSKKEIIELRIKALDKQEQETRKKAKDIQNEVLKVMQDDERQPD
jgi:prefoldin beta subunit